MPEAAMPEAVAVPGPPPDELDAPPDMEPRLGIGQVAERTGLSIHTLRFDEREGLFATPVHRGPGGRRVYSEWDVEWLEVCTRLRASGMPLTAIRQYASLVGEGTGNEEDRLRLLREHLEHVTAQIAALTESRDLVTFKIRLYETCLSQGAADPLFTPPALPR
jgi:DNA-binding transcriptional MerR regulator